MNEREIYKGIFFAVILCNIKITTEDIFTNICRHKKEETILMGTITLHKFLLETETLRYQLLLPNGAWLPHFCG